MRLRTKVLITVILAVIFFGLTQANWDFKTTKSAPHGRIDVEELKEFYAAANAELFDDSLPKDVVVNLNNTDPDQMAVTHVRLDARFVISFNKIDTPVERSAHLVMLHEMCHIMTWNNEDDPHGPRWRTCMIMIDDLGAHRLQLIDGYTETQEYKSKLRKSANAEDKSKDILSLQ